MEEDREEIMVLVLVQVDQVTHHHLVHHKVMMEDLLDQEVLEEVEGLQL